MSLALTKFLSEVAVRRGQVPIEPQHTFCDGMYTRSILIPKGTLVVGKIHLCETLNICAKGDITILTEKGAHRFKAGDVVVSAPGVQKIGYAHEDTVWVNVHHNPMNTTDLELLEMAYTRDPTMPIPEEFIKLLEAA